MVRVHEFCGTFGGLQTQGGMFARASIMIPRMSNAPLQCEVHQRAVEQARKFIHNLGPEYRAATDELQMLQGRLAAGRFHLAVLGQFKRGKSTLINALLGDEILPTSVVPLTAVPTWIEAGEPASARFTFSDGSQREFADRSVGELSSLLTQYVTEAGNPKNTLGVVQGTLFHPASILRQGVALIDTPGIGSTLKHNTDAAVAALPQCDGAVVVLSADPPITEAEIEFLKQVQSHVPRLFFVLNKMDYLDEDQRLEAETFLRSALSERTTIAGATPIFGISARLALQARWAGNADAWRRSGMPALQTHLLEFLASEKSAALREAVGRKAHAVVGQTILRLRLSLRSLQMPLDELKTRLATFDGSLEEMQRERLSVQDRLAAERRRVGALLEAQYREVKLKASHALRAAMERETSLSRTDALTELELQTALEKAIPGIFQSEFTTAFEICNRRVADALQLHKERAEQLVESVQKAAADLFDLPFHPPPTSEPFESGPTPYWRTHRWDQSFGAITPGLIDKLLPAAIRGRRIARRYEEKANVLVCTNSGKLREALAHQIDAAFTRLARGFDAGYSDALAATRGAISNALKRRQGLAASTVGEIHHLEQAIAELSQCQDRLAAA